MLVCAELQALDCELLQCNEEQVDDSRLGCAGDLLKLSHQTPAEQEALSEAGTPQPEGLVEQVHPAVRLEQVWADGE